MIDPGDSSRVSLLTAVGTAVLPFVDGSSFLAVLFGLTINASSTTGDAYLLARLLRLPAGSILYSHGHEAIYVYEPTVDRVAAGHELSPARRIQGADGDAADPGGFRARAKWPPPAPGTRKTRL